MEKIVETSGGIEMNHFVNKDLKLGQLHKQGEYESSSRKSQDSVIMTSHTLTISLDNPAGIYAPGSVVTGSVILVLSKVKKSRHITLHAYGHAKTSFTKTHYDGKENKQITYGCKKSYLDHSVVLWRPTSGRDKEEIQPGRYVFNFSFGIPWQAIPNFEGRFGHIRYNIQAEAHLSWQSNLKTERRFTVMSILDASVSNQPVKEFISQTGTFSSTKCVKGEITLPKKIYACGEDISVSVVIDNHSGTSIESIETGIQTEACYFGEASFSFCSKQKSEHECFMSFSRNEPLQIPDGRREVYRRNFTISKPLPTINNCPIIIAKHFVYVKIHKKGFFSTNVVQTVPIIITTARIEAVPLPKVGLIIPPAPRYAEEEAIVNSVVGMHRLSSTPHELRSSYRDLRDFNNLYSSTSDFRPSSVPNDFALLESFGAPPAYSEIDDTPTPAPEATAPPPEYEETFSQKF